MFLRKLMPSVADLKKQKGFSRIGDLAEKKPFLFVMKRRNVSLGFSIGLAWGVIPLPIQVFASLATCYVFKANIPAAIFAAVLTNPITSPFILALCYYLGSFFINNMNASDMGSLPPFALFIQSPITWLELATEYFSSMGETIMFGIPLTSTIFGLVGYWIVSLSWTYSVIRKRNKSLKERKLKLKADSQSLESPKDIAI
jgi:uncharacterized protein (DUF2062 family)